MTTIGPATTALRRLEADMPEGWRLVISGMYSEYPPKAWSVSALAPPFSGKSAHLNAQGHTLAEAADRCRELLMAHLQEAAA